MPTLSKKLPILYRYSQIDEDSTHRRPTLSKFSHNLNTVFVLDMEKFTLVMETQCSTVGTLFPKADILCKHDLIKLVLCYTVLELSVTYIVNIALISFMTRKWPIVKDSKHIKEQVKGSAPLKSICNQEVSWCYLWDGEITNFDEDGYMSQPIFSDDVTGLFWKKKKKCLRLPK